MTLSRTYSKLLPRELRLQSMRRAQQAWHDVRKCNPFTSNDGGDSAERQCGYQRSTRKRTESKAGRTACSTPQPSSRGGVSKPYPLPVYRALAGGLKTCREPTVISLKLRKTLMCVTGGRAAQVNADACNVRRPLAGALSDSGSRQGGEQQHGADAEQDDILEYELTGEVPGYRVSRQAPVNDTWRRKEE